MIVLPVMAGRGSPLSLIALPRKTLERLFYGGEVKGPAPEIEQLRQIASEIVRTASLTTSAEDMSAKLSSAMAAWLGTNQPDTTFRGRIIDVYEDRSVFRVSYTFERPTDSRHGEFFLNPEGQETALEVNRGPFSQEEIRKYTELPLPIPTYVPEGMEFVGAYLKDPVLVLSMKLEGELNTSARLPVIVELRYEGAKGGFSIWVSGFLLTEPGAPEEAEELFQIVRPGESVMVGPYEGALQTGLDERGLLPEFKVTNRLSWIVPTDASFRGRHIKVMVLTIEGDVLAETLLQVASSVTLEGGP